MSTLKENKEKCILYHIIHPSLTLLGASEHLLQLGLGVDLRVDGLVNDIKHRLDSLACGLLDCTQGAQRSLLVGEG